MDGKFQHKEEARALAYLRDALGDLELAEKALESKNKRSADGAMSNAKDL